MFTNYLKTIFRNLRQNKAVSFINIFGLSVGFACAILILFWVKKEFSVDQHHQDLNRLFRVQYTESLKSGKTTHVETPGILGKMLQNDYPEVEQVTRILPQGTKFLAPNHETQAIKARCFLADNNFFLLFKYPFLFGSPESCLDPNSIVISKKIADKFFPNQNPLGKSVLLGRRELIISAIIDQKKYRTHFPEFDCLLSIEPFLRTRFFNDWFLLVSNHTYIKLKNHVKAADFLNRIKDISDRYVGEKLKAENIRQSFYLEPVERIYLHSHYENDKGPRGDPNDIFLFSIIAVLILLISCGNFINLFIANSLKRLKEIGIRKFIGANRGSIITQFFLETFIVLMISTLFGSVLSQFSIKLLNHITEENFSLNFFTDPHLLLIFISLFVVILLINGVIPAWILSRFNPKQLMNNLRSSKQNKYNLKKYLVMFQFSITIFLIISTIILMDQIHFMKTKDLGFKKDNLLVLPFKPGPNSSIEYINMIKSELKNLHQVSEISFTRGVPGNSWFYDLTINSLNNSNYKKQSAQFHYVDHDYLKTFQIDLITGHDFRNKNIANYKGVLINESAVERFGFNSASEALNREIDLGDEFPHTYQVIGVYKDVHYQSLEQRINPVILTTDKDIAEPFGINANYNMINIRVVPGEQQYQELLSSIENIWKKHFPDQPFEHFFLDDQLSLQYAKQERLLTLFSVFSFLAILISCMGLYGLILFTITKQTKEIAIRKVLGSSLMNLLFVISKNYIYWTLIGNLIAWPFAWFMMNQWLTRYAYRIRINLTVFLLSGVLALIITLATISWQAIKAALTNPVDVLKYE